MSGTIKGVIKLSVSMKDIRKLQGLVFTAVNSGKMRGETLVRAIQMAKETAFHENLGEDWYVTKLFHSFSDVRDNVHRIIDQNKLKLGGNAISYEDAIPGAFIPVDEAYTKMCLCNVSGFSDGAVDALCLMNALKEIAGITLLSPERDFNFVMDYLRKLASDETSRNFLPVGFSCEAISEALNYRKLLEKEYKLDGSHVRAVKCGFFETPEVNSVYLKAISDGRNSLCLALPGAVSILATALLAATIIYLDKTKPGDKGMYFQIANLYAEASDTALTKEYHPWHQAVYIHMNDMNAKGQFSEMIRTYVNSLRIMLNDCIKAFLKDVSKDTFIKLLTAISFIQQERTLYAIYQDFSNGDGKDVLGKYEKNTDDFLQCLYYDMVYRVGNIRKGAFELELLK